MINSRNGAPGGPMYHVCTLPLESDVLFLTDEDYATVLVFIAIAAWRSGVRVLAYAIMSNHIHVIVAGDNPLLFFSILKDKLLRYLSKQGRARILSGWDCGNPIPIVSNYQARAEIAYVVRNPYVVRKDVNPLSYYWCSGFLYFNPFLKYLPGEAAYGFSLRRRRDLSHSREGDLPPGITFAGKVVNPASFVDIQAVETLFGNARAFTVSVFKSVEQQIETAERLGEKPVLPDEETVQIAYRMAKEEFGKVKYSDLSTDQRITLAKRLKYECQSSNGQIARVTKLSQWKVDAIFPIAAKR